MGGYFLTNDLKDGLIDETIRFFEEKGMIEHSIINLGSLNLIYFNKINLPKARHIFSDNLNYVIGVGTFFYKNLIGYECLKEIYFDFNRDHNLHIFNEIQGHFNFILFIEGRLIVVSDKTGTYHSYIGENDSKFYISTSYLAILENIPSITIQKQEIMEYIMTEGFYGGTTILKEINFLKFGNAYEFDDAVQEFSQKRYFCQEEFYFDEKILYKSLKDKINSYFNTLNHLDEMKISCDLSGGYDSRLVFAILKNNQINFIPNTNTNSWDSSDVKIASEISEKSKLDLKIYKKDYNNKSWADFLKKTYYLNELHRDSFGGAYSSIFFNEKSLDYEMILGGYGGELYRDIKYRGVKSFNYLIENQYINQNLKLLFSKSEIREYKKNLEIKLRRLLDNKNGKLSKKNLEKIYFFNKMMYWGGSRITYFNQYCYRFHPLLDYSLIFPLFAIGQKEKKNGKFMMKLMHEFNPEVTSINSSYEHDFKWSNKKNISLTLKTMKKKVFQRLKRIKTNLMRYGIESRMLGRRLSNKILLSKHPTIQNSVFNYIKDEMIISKFFNQYFDLFSRQEGCLGDFMGRIYSIERILIKNEKKIKNDDGFSNK